MEYPGIYGARIARIAKSAKDFRFAFSDFGVSVIHSFSFENNQLYVPSYLRSEFNISS